MEIYKDSGEDDMQTIQESEEWKSLKRRFQEIEKQHNRFSTQLENSDKVFKDMYLGDGKENPSMTSRMLQVEEAVERWAKDSSQIKKWLFGILASLLVNIILHFWK
jgi:seryl-tRNA synthetase